jgi:hypothetical protein
MSDAKKTATKATKTVKTAKKVKFVAGEKNPKKNPYRAGKVYAIGFTAIQKAQIITRSALLEIISAAIKVKRPDATDEQILTAAEATTTVLLSPRDESKVREGADCRGNASAMGHVYYMDALKRKKGEEKRFRFRWRPVVLESRSYRKAKAAKVAEVPQTKAPTAKAKKSTKAKKAEAKAAEAEKAATATDEATA